MWCHALLLVSSLASSCEYMLLLCYYKYLRSIAISYLSSVVADGDDDPWWIEFQLLVIRGCDVDDIDSQIINI